MTEQRDTKSAAEPIRRDDQPQPIKPLCTGHSSRTGEPCKLHPVHGAAVCHKHGGSAPRVRRAAARRLAVAEWGRSFGEPVADADPAATVLEEIAYSVGHVRWLRERVQETDPEALVWGVESKTTRGSGEFPGVDLVESARANAWVQLYGQERDRLLKQCEIAARMGIEQKFVDLAEKTGEVIGRLVAGLLGDLNLTADQQQAAAAALPRHLRLVAGQLNGGEGWPTQ